MAKKTLKDKEELVFVSYGCYLSTTTEVWAVDLKVPGAEDLLNDELYLRAYDDTDNWVGSHGFADYDKDEFEDEKELAEQIHQDIENNLEYYWEPFDPEKHYGDLTTSTYDAAMVLYNELQNARNSE